MPPADAKPRIEQSNSTRVDIQSVPFAPLDDLGITSDNIDARLGCRSLHGGDHSPEQIQLQSLLEDKPRRQVERLGALHGDIVYRTAHSKPAHIPARK